MKRIIIASDICNGQPVIAGTRITAQTVLEFLAAGDSIEDVLEEYPALDRPMIGLKDVLACLRFSSLLIDPLSNLFDQVGQIRLVKTDS
jgi:uncharacterized protein (DUF433 family)